MGGGGGGRGGRDGGGRGGKRSQNRVIVSGLPPSGSWQDLKDHMRDAGDVCFSDVFKDGTGAVEYRRYEDMKYALKKLDDTKFKSHEGETSYVRVKEDYGSDGASSSKRSKSRSRTRSRSRKRSRDSPTYSPVRRERSHSRSKSRSCTEKRSRSRS